MVKVKVFVTLKEGVLDPQGKAVKGALHSMDYFEVSDVTIGKYMELTLEENVNIKERVQEMCEKLLANPVIEEYHYEIEEALQR
ncbi:phosphoribosylformylglycinamidine synthase subunit PurS [Lottiidibacillus patelloidae]|uniref:Phosphoribosylformylglycinamidine synthase subunit PurS n=1 Tax=Lottiidibacillus patelloidae TaxID=2670334 RepID=A0A263BS85_9BACI|nr:phosphoribosylformylglycinamidine synthase subunit PurS [Lottiidibacillus patelloidae]OZM56237.1 phosphoribosylformylglycinamidine synthase subunit PurS [Lottiidibacillus patelloidae]